MITINAVRFFVMSIRSERRSAGIYSFKVMIMLQGGKNWKTVCRTESKGLKRHENLCRLIHSVNRLLSRLLVRL